ncbi:MAG: hypothetical protein WDN25_03800 [Acetobacteraceae bacterium]
MLIDEIVRRHLTVGSFPDPKQVLCGRKALTMSIFVNKLFAQARESAKLGRRHTAPHEPIIEQHDLR